MEVGHYIVKNVSESVVELPEYGQMLDPEEEYDLYDHYGPDEQAAYLACNAMTATSIYQGLHAPVPTLHLKVEMRPEEV